MNKTKITPLDGKSNTETKEQKETDDKCTLLKNIEYQSMLINPDFNTLEKREKETITNIHNMLDNEIIQTNKEKQPWSKLNKLCKINKLMEYSEKCKIDYQLSEEEVIELRDYLKRLLDRKKLVRVKDVVYDKEKGEIIKINDLCIEKKDNKHRFTLKQNDKKKSSLNNLSPYTKKKTIKDHKVKNKNKRLSIV